VTVDKVIAKIARLTFFGPLQHYGMQWTE